MLGVLQERLGEGGLLILGELSLLAGYLERLGLLLGPVNAVARQGADASSFCLGVGELDLTRPVAVFTRQAVLALVAVTLDGVAHEQGAAAVGG